MPITPDDTVAQLELGGAGALEIRVQQHRDRHDGWRVHEQGEHAHEQRRTSAMSPDGDTRLARLPNLTEDLASAPF